MTQSRLTLALAAAGPLPATGTVIAYRARGDADLSALPAERLRIVQGFRPDHDALAARGFAVAPEPEGSHAAAVVFVTRSRAGTRGLLADAAGRLPEGAPIWVDGQKTDGIDSVLKDLRARAAVGEPFAKAHGKAFRLAAPGPQALADWRARPLHPAPGFETLPGIFSAEAVDRGSALLAAALPERLGATVADLGAGWGWLAAQILARPGIAELHLVEAEHAALACARRNVADPRARFHWADARQFRPERRFDAVVTNPPFHVARAADPALGIAFLRAAAGMLAPSGQLWLVANRHLPYERALAELFHDVAEAGGDPGFKVLRALRPAGARRRA